MFSARHKVLFFWDCSLMRHSDTPPNTRRVQSHPAPPPCWMILYCTCPDADVFNAGYSLTIGYYPSPVSLFHPLWNRSMGIIQNQWEKLALWNANWYSRLKHCCCNISKWEHTLDCCCLNSQVNIWIDLTSIAGINVKLWSSIRGLNIFLMSTCNSFQR